MNYKLYYDKNYIENQIQIIKKSKAVYIKRCEIRKRHSAYHNIDFTIRTIHENIDKDFTCIFKNIEKNKRNLISNYLQDDSLEEYYKSNHIYYYNLSYYKFYEPIKFDTYFDNIYKEFYKYSYDVIRYKYFNEQCKKVINLKILNKLLCNDIISVISKYLL